MFTTARRDRVLDVLLVRAQADSVITAAAVVGSGARGDTDQWSDVDLVLRLAPGAEPQAVADAWADALRVHDDVVAQLDVWSGPALYRVFLLADALQVDLSFWPAGTFASNGEPFDLRFGATDSPATVPDSADPLDVVGWAWLYALHVRSAIARQHPWQAVQLLDGLRDRLVTLACRRHGLPAHQGRGVDRLPDPVLHSLARTLVPEPEPDQLRSAFLASVKLLLVEVDHLDADLAARLRPTLTSLVDPPPPPGQ